MEYDQMSASFASICGKDIEAENLDKQRSLASETRCSDIAGGPQDGGGAVCGPAPCDASSAHASFISIVNAKNCANANGEEILKGYMTLARQGTFLRTYMC
jgi:hypothetical protein